VYRRLTELFSAEEIEKTRQLLELFDQNELVELSAVEPDGYSVQIARTTPPVACSAPLYSQVAGPVSTVATRHVETPPTKAVPAAPKHTLDSPMVGIFYTSPTPSDPPFIVIGQSVQVGQTIGLIEAMKVFSEIPAEIAGKIVEIIGVSGSLVQQSQPLFGIEPL
jgi:acetyl-CoA carboxylase biotin carboxyl carrier protein